MQDKDERYGLILDLSMENSHKTDRDWLFHQIECSHAFYTQDIVQLAQNDDHKHGEFWIVCMSIHLQIISEINHYH